MSAPAVRARRVAVVDTHRGRDTRLLIAGASCTGGGVLLECWHRAPQGAWRLRSGPGRGDELSFIPSSLTAGAEVEVEIYGAIHSAPAVCIDLGFGSPFAHLVAEPRFTAFSLGDAEILLIGFPRMDVLIEVTGSPDGVDRAIDALGIPRALFCHATLPELVKRFEGLNSSAPGSGRALLR